MEIHRTYPTLLHRCFSRNLQHFRDNFPDSRTAPRYCAIWNILSIEPEKSPIGNKKIEINEHSRTI